MKIVSIIPARSGSKSIKEKNIVDLCGQPLIAYTILDSIRTKSIDETFVSTDSETIQKEAIKYGAEAPFLRPTKYATDNSPDLQWAWHFLLWFEDTYKYLPELLIHLRATTPIRQIDIIENAISIMQTNKEASALRSVEEFSESPFKWVVILNNRLTPLFGKDIEITNLPKQVFPKIYRPNGYIDILRPEVVLSGNLHGTNIFPFITEPSIEIDSYNDLKLAEMVLNNDNND